MSVQFNKQSLQKSFTSESTKSTYYSLRALEKAGIKNCEKLPLSIKVLLESAGAQVLLIKQSLALGQAHLRNGGQHHVVTHQKHNFFTLGPG